MIHHPICGLIPMDTASPDTAKKYITEHLYEETFHSTSKFSVLSWAGHFSTSTYGDQNGANRAPEVELSRVACLYKHKTLPPFRLLCNLLAIVASHVATVREGRVKGWEVSYRERVDIVVWYSVWLIRWRLVSASMRPSCIPLFLSCTKLPFKVFF